MKVVVTGINTYIRHDNLSKTGNVTSILKNEVMFIPLFIK